MTKASKLKEKKLFEAFLLLKSADEVERFCVDLMTEAEIREFAGRLEVAKKLNEGLPQREVSKETDVSIATVTRVNKWLKSDGAGYKLIIDRIGDED